MNEETHYNDFLQSINCDARASKFRIPIRKYSRLNFPICLRLHRVEVGRS
jgi:hypothetical protein